MRERRMLGFPSQRNPGSPGLRIVVRKSDGPDLRWGGVRGGGRRCVRKRRHRLLIASPPSPPLLRKGGGRGESSAWGAA
jgi:hypothetical protein